MREKACFAPPRLQYYFNSLLQLKDEMVQLGKRLQPADSDG